MPENDTLDILASAGIVPVDMVNDAPPQQQNQAQQQAAPTEQQSNQQEQPPAQQQQEAQQAQPKFNFDEELVKITNGTIKSQTDLASLLEKNNKFSDFESRENEYLTTKKQLEEENTSLKAKVNTDPFVNDYVKKLNDLYRGGASHEQIEAFSRLNKVSDFESLSPYDAKLMALQLKEGLTEQEARTYLNTQYNLNKEEFDEDIVAKEQIRLKVDARADRDFLKNHKAEVSKIPASETEVQRQQLEQQQTAQIEKLQPIAKNVIKDLSFKDININGKQGDGAKVADLTPTEDSLKTLEPQIQNFIKTNWQHIPTTEEGAKAIETFARNMLVLQNWQNWQHHVAAVTEKEVRAEYHNPSPINRGNDAAQSGKTGKEEREQIVRELYNL